jgi:hypothetical protein
MDRLLYAKGGVSNPARAFRHHLSSAAHRHSAIHDELRAGNEPGLVRGQEQHRVRRVAAVAGEAQRDARDLCPGM